MLAAARKYKRVVQVGMQRRSTPHLVEARDRVIQRRQARQDRPRRDLLLLPHAGDRAIRPTPRRPITSITRCGPARRRCGRTTSSCIRAAGARSWNTATASSATCASTCSTWCAGCWTSAWPTRVSSSGGILVDKDSKANITDTQTATFDFGDLQVVWTHRILGRSARSEVSVGRDVLRRQGHAQGQRDGLRLHPVGQGRHADPRRRDLRAGAVSRGQDREGSREARRAGDPRAHEGLPGVRSSRAARRWPTSSRATSRRPPASSPTCR